MAHESFVRQAAAVAVRGRRICLVRTGRGKCWVVPKGHVEAWQSPSQTAAQEAWEEAGLVGTVDPHVLGRYCYTKRGRCCRVTVFLLRVTSVAERWPERHKRRRRWVPIHEAADSVGHPNLRILLQRVLGGLEATSRARRAA